MHASSALPPGAPRRRSGRARRGRATAAAARRRRWRRRRGGGLGREGVRRVKSRDQVAERQRLRDAQAPQRVAQRRGVAGRPADAHCRAPVRLERALCRQVGRELRRGAGGAGGVRARREGAA
jgi:hypothetical protein